MTDPPRDLVIQFISAINRHDVEALGALMPGNHRFVDSGGGRVRGRDEAMRAWAGFFRMFPDYRMEVHRILHDDGSVAVFGSARGTWAAAGVSGKANRWEVPAAWEANVRDGRVAVWRVFSDTEPLRRILGGISNR